MKKIQLISALFIAIAFTACGPDLEGKYSSKGDTYDFKSDGKVFENRSGTVEELQYGIDGEKIIIKDGGGNSHETLTILSDGSLKGELGSIYKK